MPSFRDRMTAREQGRVPRSPGLFRKIGKSARFFVQDFKEGVVNAKDYFRGARSGTEPTSGVVV